MLMGNLFILPKVHAATAFAAVVAFTSYSRVVVIKNFVATPLWLTREQRERK